MIGRAPIPFLLILVAQMLRSGPSEADILVRNVDVITMTSEEIARACDVLIRGERFLAVAPAGTIPAPVHGEVIDGTGKFLGIREDKGTIEAGKAADAVLLTANPLDDVGRTRDIAGVFVRGDWFPQEEIEARLAGIKERAIQSTRTK